MTGHASFVVSFVLFRFRLLSLLALGRSGQCRPYGTDPHPQHQPSKALEPALVRAVCVPPFPECV